MVAVRVDSLNGVDGFPGIILASCECAPPETVRSHIDSFVFGVLRIAGVALMGLKTVFEFLLIPPVVEENSITDIVESEVVAI